jgi:predicted RecA/RadA family phage recombinase
MAEYLPLHDEGDSITRAASAAITGGQLVVVSGSGTVAAASAASASWLGVAAFDASSGDNVTVYASGVQRLVATGTVTAGQLVEAATNGTVATHTNGTSDFNVVGLALTTATAGNAVEVKLAR